MEEKELIKYVESFCEYCMMWIYIKNCKACLYNILEHGRKGEGQTSEETE